MNRTEQLLALLWEQAKRGPKLREKLLASKNAKDPMDDFCQSAKQAGYDISVGELFALGQESSDNQCKSTNGGNPSPYASFEDAYENFISSLE